MRTINVVIGSKSFFQEQTKDLLDAESFLDMIKLSDAYHGKNQIYPENLKAQIMILQNDNYHGITEPANDRLGNLIYDLTTDDSEIWIHNPPSNLLFFLHNLLMNMKRFLYYNLNISYYLLLKVLLPL